MGSEMCIRDRARITLYELLRLSKSTREALQKALANAEVFMTQVPQEEDVEDCVHTSQNAPCITFTAEDMQVKGKHDRPLYFTGYIGSSEVNRIQVDQANRAGSCNIWAFLLIV